MAPKTCPACVPNPLHVWSYVMDPFDSVALILIVLVFLLLANFVRKGHKQHKREQALLALLKANPGKSFGAQEVANALKLNTTKAYALIESLPGDQSWGWAYTIEGDQYGRRITHVARTNRPSRR